MDLALNKLKRLICQKTQIINQPTLCSTGTAKNKLVLFFFIFFFFIFFFFLLIIPWSGLLVGIKRSLCIPKYLRILCISFSKTDSRLCIYHLVVWSNFNFQLIIFPTQSGLIFYYLFTCLLHSLIMWYIISSLSPFNQHSVFCCVLSIFALT